MVTASARRIDGRDAASASPHLAGVQEPERVERGLHPAGQRHHVVPELLRDPPPLQDAHAEGHVAGLDLVSGEEMDPVQEGVYDSFRVLRNSIASATGIASNLLLCDEMLKARQMGRSGPPGGGEE